MKYPAADVGGVFHLDGLYIYAVFYFSANQLISTCNLF